MKHLNKYECNHEHKELVGSKLAQTIYECETCGSTIIYITTHAHRWADSGHGHWDCFIKKLLIYWQCLECDAILMLPQGEEPDPLANL